MLRWGLLAMDASINRRGVQGKGGALACACCFGGATTSQVRPAQWIIRAPRGVAVPPSGDLSEETLLQLQVTK